MKERLDLTITIVSWNTRDLLRRCIESVLVGRAQSSIEVHVVDNASSDGSAEMVRRSYPEVTLIENSENVGFARANNQSWKQATGRYWMLLNSDTEVSPGALDRLVDFMDRHPDAGLATARLVSPDGSAQHCAQRVPGFWSTGVETARLHKLLPAWTRGRLMLGPYWSYDEPIKLGWTWGTALIARRDAVEEAGPLSEDFFMYGEDLEWCLRIRQHGWKIWFCPEAEVLHHGGGSSNGKWSDQKKFEAIMDGLNKALAMRRGGVYASLLRAFTLACVGAELIISRVSGRSFRQTESLLAYYWKSIKGPVKIEKPLAAPARPSADSYDRL
jgi:N-acetylglucosaminyl-diphospho-decaprenol L-rhamnosyltransferase